MIIHSAKQSPSLMVHATSVLLPCHTLKNMRLFSVFVGIHGLTISRQPKERTIAFAGSNVTFSWNLILTPKEEKEELEVWFGTWTNDVNSIKLNLKKFTMINGLINVTDMKDNKQKAKRWHWNGDISRNYSIAYQLTNAQYNDTGDYGIEVRVDTFPAKKETRGPFSLAIRVRHFSVKIADIHFFFQLKWSPLLQPERYITIHFVHYCVLFVFIMSLDYILSNLLKFAYHILFLSLCRQSTHLLINFLN